MNRRRFLSDAAQLGVGLTLIKPSLKGEESAVGGGTRYPFYKYQLCFHNNSQPVHSVIENRRGGFLTLSISTKYFQQQLKCTPALVFHTIVTSPPLVDATV